MKKIINFLLIILILITPFEAYAAEITSPSLKGLIKIVPAINFDFITSEKTNLDLNFYKPEQLAKYFFDENKNYELEEGLILYIEHKMEAVEFFLLNKYNEENIIYGIFLNEEEIAYVIQAVVTEAGSLIFDLSPLDPENTIFTLLIFKKSNDAQ